MHWFWDTHVGRVAAIASIASASAGLGGWAASTLDITQLPKLAQKGIIFATIGVWLPATVVLVLIVVALAKKPRPDRITAGDVARELVEGCLANLQLFALELGSESGPDFLRAQMKQHAVIHGHLLTSGPRFQRDKRHLEFLAGSRTHSSFNKFVALKTKAIEGFTESVNKLAQKTNKHDDARECIVEAGECLKRCANELQNAIDNFAWSD